MPILPVTAAEMPEQVGDAPGETGDLVTTLELTRLGSIGSAARHAGIPLDDDTPPYVALRFCGTYSATGQHI
jgi:hypothetical protein